MAWLMVAATLAAPEGIAYAQDAAAPPVIVEITTSSGAAAVSWEAAAGSGGAAVVAYDLRWRRSDAGDDGWTVVDGIWVSGPLKGDVTGLANGVEHAFEVRAVTGAGDGGWSSAVSATPRTSAPPIAVHPGDRSLTVAWERPPDLEASADANYEISWIASDQAGRPGARWHATRTTWAGARHVLLGPTRIANDVRYDVRVRAVTDHAGQWSVASATAFQRADEATWSTRPAIPFGVPVGGFQDAAGLDHFNIELAARTGLLLRTGGNVRDTYCRLFHSTGEPVSGGQSHRSGGYPGIKEQCALYVILDPGDYYLTVNGLDFRGGRNHGSFYVQAEIVPPTGDSLETALPATRGQPRFGHFGDDASEADYWRLDIAEREFIDVHIEDLNSTVRVSLHDSAGAEHRAYVTPLHTRCFVRNGHVTCEENNTRVRAELAAGTYYIKIRPKYNWASYVLERHVDYGYEHLVTECESLGRGEGVNDALAGCQWHLHSSGQRGARAGEDANVDAAHRAGHLGEGVHVAVVDTGIDLGHRDLAANTDPERSRAYCGSDTAPFDPGSDHGTAVAGLVAARDNTIGMRGVAPRATLHNRRMLGLGCDPSDEDIADAMTYSMTDICVNTSSWGYVDGPWATPAPLLFDLAVAEGLTAGCDGKGIAYVRSAGNGHLRGDDSNLGEYSNHYGVTAVCAVNAHGQRSTYSEEGANLWVCGPSNDLRAGLPGIATTTNGDRYRRHFGGTSAATPIVAGVAALARGANRDLAWRDVKLILAASARRNDLDDTGWVQGAAKYREPDERYWYNRQYGFGVVDAAAAVELAEEWTSLPPMITRTQASDGEAFQIPDAPASISRSVTFDDAIEFVEFVQLDTSLQTPHLRDLRIELVPPSGTGVLVMPELPSRPSQGTPLNEPFRFGVAQLLGEAAQGAWTLRISGKKPDHRASVESWGITLYGHRLRPSAPKLTSVDQTAAEELTVAWEPPAHAGASPVTGYELRHTAADETGGEHSSRTAVPVPGGASASSHTLSGLPEQDYDIEVRALNSEGAGAWSPALTGTVGPAANVEPEFAAGTVSLQVVENTAAGTAIGDAVAATDDDDGAVLTYALSGADAAGFAIDGATGQLSVSSPRDFEMPADGDGDNMYELSVSVSDGLDGAGDPDASADDSIEVTVEVLDEDEPPVLAGECPAAVAASASGDWMCVFTASDPEGEAVTWSLSGADAALFEIDAGVLSLVGEADVEAPGDSDADNTYEVTVEATAGDHAASADVSLTVVVGNRPPVFRGWSDTHDRSLPGFLVSLHMSKADFSDPDGDPLTFTLSASRSDVYVPGGLQYNESVERIFYIAKTSCALAGLDPPIGDAFYTVVTFTATDPSGASAHATATFRTDPTVFECPSLTGATVDGAAVTLVFDVELAPSYFDPTAGEFEVRVNGFKAGLANADAVTVTGNTISLTLASPVSASQTVTVSYVPDASPVAAAFADRAATNNTPAPEEPAAPGCIAVSENATMPACAAVSGSELTLTFNRDLAAIDDAAAGEMRFLFLVQGAFYQGAPVVQSPQRVVVDGATVTLTLGTAVLPGDVVTVSYYGGILHDTDGTPVAGFTATLTTTLRT